MEVTLENNGLEIVGLMAAGAILVVTCVLFYLRKVQGRSADLRKRDEKGNVIKE